MKRPDCTPWPIYNAGAGSDTARMIRIARFFIILCASLCAVPASAQEGALSALAKLNANASEIAAAGDGLAVTLSLSQPVPWRVRVLNGPPRLLLDFREVDWSNLADLPVDSDAILGLRAGVFRPTWSRLVIDLPKPMVVARSEMATSDAGAQVAVTLRGATDGEFAAAAALPEPPEWALPRAADLPPPRLPLSQRTGPLIVVLDPGHGGLDPGAEQGSLSEANLMLTFARELKEVLLRTGEVEVVLTREQDIFVPLEERVSIARAAAGDVFISLHADALAEGAAKGATIYSLSAEATDEAAQTLAERHDRDDLLAGVDLTAQDDLIARVLIDMARLETTPRTGRLAQALESAIKAADIKMHRNAQQTAGFSVLKSPDIPSVLLELGFLSSDSDRANLTDPSWRARMADAIKTGVLEWAAAERARPPAP